MATVSDELVERVALALAAANNYGERSPSWRERSAARAAIEALSTPEFVLPLAEEMLRSVDTYDVTLMRTRPAAVVLCNMHGVKIAYSRTLLDAYHDAYRAAKGE